MDKTIQIGQLAPEFEAGDQNGNAISLKDFAPFWLVLYFYPKDNTPGCTTLVVGSIPHHTPRLLPVACCLEII